MTVSYPLLRGSTSTFRKHDATMGTCSHQRSPVWVPSASNLPTKLPYATRLQFTPYPPPNHLVRRMSRTPRRCRRNCCLLTQCVLLVVPYSVAIMIFIVDMLAQIRRFEQGSLRDSFLCQIKRSTFSQPLSTPDPASSCFPSFPPSYRQTTRQNISVDDGDHVVVSYADPESPTGGLATQTIGSLFAY